MLLSKDQQLSSDLLHLLQGERKHSVVVNSSDLMAIDQNAKEDWTQ